MYALAGYHNDETDECYPSQQTLALRTGLSQDTVARALKALETAEPPLVLRTPRGAAGGGRGTDDYDLLFADPDRVAVLWKAEREAAKIRKMRVGGSPHDAGRGVDQTPQDAEGVKPENPHPAARKPAPCGGNLESNQQGKKKESSLPSNGSKAEHLETAEKVWAIIPQSQRRKAESKAVVAKAIQEQVNKGADPARIVAGMAAYYADEGNAREDHKWTRAAFRVIRDGIWEQWAPETVEAEGEVDLFGGPADDDGPAPPGGWIADWQGRAWVQEWLEAPDSWLLSRGPEPGQPDCRIRPTIQAEFLPAGGQSS